MKRYRDDKARQVAAIASTLGRGSEPTSELLEACRDLTAAIAIWARRNGYEPAVKDKKR